MQVQDLLLEIEHATLYQYSKSVSFDIAKLHFLWNINYGIGEQFY